MEFAFSTAAYIVCSALEARLVLLSCHCFVYCWERKKNIYFFWYLSGVTVASEDILGWAHHHEMIENMSGHPEKLLQLKFPTGKREYESERVKSLLCADNCLCNCYVSELTSLIRDSIVSIVSKVRHSRREKCHWRHPWLFL